MVEGKTLESEDPDMHLDAAKEIDIEEAKKQKPDAKPGDVIRNEITPTDGVAFGRIAAQTAKQVIIQKLRERDLFAKPNLIAREYMFFWKYQI